MYIYIYIYSGICVAVGIATVGNIFQDTGTLEIMLLQMSGVCDGELLGQCLAVFHASNHGKIGSLVGSSLWPRAGGSA